MKVFAILTVIFLIQTSAQAFALSEVERVRNYLVSVVEKANCAADRENPENLECRKQADHIGLVLDKKIISKIDTDSTSMVIRQEIEKDPKIKTYSSKENYNLFFTGVAGSSREFVAFRCSILVDAVGSSYYFLIHACRSSKDKYAEPFSKRLIITEPDDL